MPSSEEKCKVIFRDVCHFRVGMVFLGRVLRRGFSSLADTAELEEGAYVEHEAESG